MSVNICSYFLNGLVLILQVRSVCQQICTNHYWNADVNVRGKNCAFCATCEWDDMYLWQGTYTAASKQLRGGGKIKNLQYCYSFASFTVWYSWQMNNTALEQLLLLDFSSLANQQGLGVYETLLFCWQNVQSHCEFNTLEAFLFLRH